MRSRIQRQSLRYALRLTCHLISASVLLKARWIGIETQTGRRQILANLRNEVLGNKQKIARLKLGIFFQVLGFQNFFYVQQMSFEPALRNPSK